MPLIGTHTYRHTHCNKLQITLISPNTNIHLHTPTHLFIHQLPVVVSPHDSPCCKTHQNPSIIGYHYWKEAGRREVCMFCWKVNSKAKNNYPPPPLPLQIPSGFLHSYLTSSLLLLWYILWNVNAPLISILPLCPPFVNRYSMSLSHQL